METWQHKARLNGSQTGQTGDILSPQKKLLQSNEYKENLISWACVSVCIILWRMGFLQSFRFFKLHLCPNLNNYKKEKRISITEKLET